MITHVVLIRWKDGISAAEVDAVLETARQLRKIDGVMGVAIHRNLGIAQPQYGKGIGHVFMIRVPDLAALETFRSHPTHKAYGQKFHPIAHDVTIVDIEE
jgi:Stress responsive A/B Barrel Domain